jgi:predicted NBD/HSP70 family sugar kinase
MPAPSYPPSSSPRTLGSNQIGMREFNERVILQAVRLHGSLAKAELARLTRLSTQTVSVIINRLLDEGLVRKLDSLRGKVGQPSQPIALAPDGAFAIGVRIGRRRLDVMLLDFTGAVRYQASIDYVTPGVDAVFAEIAVQLDKIAGVLGDKVDRLTGVGLAAPLMFGGWQKLVRMSAQDADAWTRTSMRERLQALTPLPVQFAKDTAAACVAELVAGQGRQLKSYLYLFVDVLIGGALVIGGQPHTGLYGNAGAVGSMPLAVANGPGRAPQLLASASLLTLEEMQAAARLEVLGPMDERMLAGPWLAVTERWLVDAAGAIAFAINGSACLLDLDGVIVDGAMHPSLLTRLLDAIRTAMGRYNWEGVMRPELHQGTIGADAKVIGAACLPLHANFAPAHDLFLKLG